MQRQRSSSLLTVSVWVLSTPDDVIIMGQNISMAPEDWRWPECTLAGSSNIIKAAVVSSATADTHLQVFLLPIIQEIIITNQQITVATHADKQIDSPNNWLGTDHSEGFNLEMYPDSSAHRHTDQAEHMLVF